MTKRELNQTYYLKKEIADEYTRLAQLEASKAPPEVVDETRRVIELKKAEAELSLQRVMRVILGIEDIRLRRIFWLRHIELKSWAAIAVDVGGGNTPDGVRIAHDRHIPRISET